MASPQASEYPILEAMREGVDYRFTLKIRGLTVSARPLASIEIINANVAVDKRLADLDERAQVQVTRSVLLAQEMLIAATSSDVGANDSKITAMQFERMTPDEIQSLYKQYLSGVERVNPMLEFLPSGTSHERVEQVRKSPDRTSVLIELSFSDLVSVCRFLLETDGE